MPRHGGGAGKAGTRTARQRDQSDHPLSALDSQRALGGRCECSCRQCRTRPALTVLAMTPPCWRSLGRARFGRGMGDCQMESWQAALECSGSEGPTAVSMDLHINTGKSATGLVLGTASADGGAGAQRPVARPGKIGSSAGPGCGIELQGRRSACLLDRDQAQRFSVSGSSVFRRGVAGSQEVLGGISWRVARRMPGFWTRRSPSGS